MYRSLDIPRLSGLLITVRLTKRSGLATTILSTTPTRKSAGPKWKHPASQSSPELGSRSSPEASQRPPSALRVNERLNAQELVHNHRRFLLAGASSGYLHAASRSGPPRLEALEPQRVLDV